MKVYSINNNCDSVRNNNINFTSTKKGSLLTKSVIEHFGLNMETLIGYKGKKFIAPIPETVDSKTAAYLRKLCVDWNTHISKYAAKNKKVLNA